MRNVAVLAIVGIFVLSALSGCGKVTEKEDFMAWRDQYTQERQQEHESIKGDLTADFDGKLAQQNTSLTESISDTRNEAITTAQEGDAETIATAQEFALEQDAQLRDQLTRTANEAGQKAQQFAQQGDDALRQQLRTLEQQTISQVQNSVASLQTKLTAAEQQMTATKSLAERKPRQVAVINFASGRASLTDAAKQKLDVAVREIKQNSDFIVKVVGHTDGNPVLSGRYRSNWDLSQARADAAAKYLKEQGVTNTLVPLARAHTQPVDQVTTQAGRVSSRRVEVIIVPPGTVIE